MSTAAAFIPPMELLSVTRLPEGPQWTYEVKLDGYRAQFIQGARARLFSRRGKDFGSQFAETRRTLAIAVPTDSVIDGELVALDGHGRPNFQLIQNSKSSDAPVVFFAFDILRLAGRDLCGLPLAERQQQLRDALQTSDLVQLSESFQVAPAQMLAAAKEHGLEGVVAKRLDSKYESGRRSGAWQKLCLVQAHEFVVGGFLPGDHGVEALLIGFYKGRVALLRERSGGLRSRFTPRVVRAASTPRYHPLPFCERPGAVAGTMGTGVDRREDKELCLAPTARRRQVLVPRVDDRGPLEAGELRWHTRGHPCAGGL